MRLSYHILLLGAASVSLAACASDVGKYPSLARRPAERISGSFQPAPPPVAQPPGPEVLGKLDGLVSRARSADARFGELASGARAQIRAASGAPVASESWAAATIALSGLESSRSEAMIALADLDALYAQEQIAGSDTTAIEFARSQVLAIVAEQDAVLADLRGVLAS